MSKKSRREKEYHNPCELSFKLDNEQVSVRTEILNNDITVLVGCAGTGKTYVACATGLKMLLDGEVDQVIITRPMVSSENMGFLPGSMEEKASPWFKPIFDNLCKMYSPEHLQAYLNGNKIEMLPLQFTRGVTYDNAFVIIDEAQNMTLPQMKMVLTRIGEGSKIVLCGDYDQIDLHKKSESGLMKIKDFDVNGMIAIEMFNEHRKPIVLNLLKEFKRLEDEEQEGKNKGVKKELRKNLSERSQSETVC